MSEKYKPNPEILQIREYELFQDGVKEENIAIISGIRKIFESSELNLVKGEPNKPVEYFIKKLQDKGYHCVAIDRKSIEVLVNGTAVRGTVSNFCRAYFQQEKRAEKFGKWVKNNK